MSIKEVGTPQKLKNRQVPFCPHCKHQLDGFTSLNHQEQPSPGDVSVCVKCFEMLIFSKALTLRKPSVLEIDAMDPEQLSTISDAIKMLHQFDQYKKNKLTKVACKGVGDNDGFFEVEH